MFYQGKQTNHDGIFIPAFIVTGCAGLKTKSHWFIVSVQINVKYKENMGHQNLVFNFEFVK
jgi:hypothetical protein